MAFSTKKSQEELEKYYPGAVEAQTFLHRILKYLKASHKLEPSSVVYATSFCSDDLNNVEFPRDTGMIGPFILGGLGGFPFAGVGGVQAFAHHVPHDGAMVIIYAPHIGIPEDGKVGTVVRPGAFHAEPSPCCGALQSSLERIKELNDRNPNDDGSNYQQEKLDQIVYFSKERILGGGKSQTCEPLPGPVVVAQVAYENIRSKILYLVSTIREKKKESSEKTLVLLVGGILINSDNGKVAHFQLKQAEHCYVGKGFQDSKYSDVTKELSKDSH